jgi:drug/metabolite transporter (DMT)-like permease
MADHRRELLPFAWMLCGSILFAVMGSMAHALGETLDWQLIAIARSSLPLLFAACLALAAGTRLVLFGPPILWVRSIAGSLSMVATFYALTRLPVSDVFTLTNVFPIWVALLSWPMLRQRPSPRVWICVVSGIAGVALIQQPYFTQGNLACLAALGASVFTAFAMLGLHQLRALDPLAIVVHFSGVALVFCTASFFLFERHTLLPDLVTGPKLLMVLGVGVSATIGQLFLTKAYTWGQPMKVSVVGLTQIVFALLLDIVLFGHRVNTASLVGMGLVLVPTAWIMTHRLEGGAELAAGEP